MLGPALLVIGRRWFGVLTLGSAIFVFVTFLSFVFEETGASRLLFWIGLAGENNIGAWWSGMLLLLAAVFAFDGATAAGAGQTERKGWLALALVLLFLSFDEVGSLHEHLASFGIANIGALAIVVFGVTCYALLQLYRARTGARVWGQLLLAFGLLGTVPLHEYIQHRAEWPSSFVYGLRAAFEEGTELVAILLLVAITSRNTLGILRASPREIFSVTRYRVPILISAAVLAPVLVAATFVLPYPGGPANWLAASLFFGCALLVVRQMILTPNVFNAAATALLVWYLVASVGSNAVRLDWDPSVLGTRIGIRGLFVTMLLLTAVPVLRSARRSVNPLAFGVAALAALIASLWPQSQLLWCAVPPLLAVWLYQIESKTSASERVPIEAAGSLAAAGPTEGSSSARARL